MPAVMAFSTFSSILQTFSCNFFKSKTTLSNQTILEGVETLPSVESSKSDDVGMKWLSAADISCSKYSVQLSDFNIAFI